MAELLKEQMEQNLAKHEELQVQAHKPAAGMHKQLRRTVTGFFGQNEFDGNGATGSSRTAGDRQRAERAACQVCCDT